MKILIGLQSMKRLLSVRVIKVALAMFIFVSMMANIFIPRNIENKEQIVSVIRVVFDNVIVKTIRGCRDTLIAMSNELTRELYKLLMLDDVGTDVPVKREQEKETPVNTSSDNGIEIESRYYKEKIRYIQEGLVISLTVGKVEQRLYRLYGNIKLCCINIYSVVILFFIVFIVVIRERKEYIQEQIKSILKDKTNLCLK